MHECVVLHLHSIYKYVNMHVYLINDVPLNAYAIQFIYSCFLRIMLIYHMGMPQKVKDTDLPFLLSGTYAFYQHGKIFRAGMAG